MMKGGKLLSEGGFGCVFSPGINCNGSIINSKKYVSKIQRFNKNARNEIKIGKILQDVKGFENHFAPILKFCSIDVAKVKDNDIKKCTVLKKHSTEDFVVMKLNYINGMDFIDYIVEHKNSVQIISNLINSYNHLLKSISMMIGKKVFHGDLKGTNILFDLEKQEPILIDFGLSVSIDDVKERNLKTIFYIFAPEYYVWPLEVHYLNYILHENKEPTTEDLKKIAKVFTQNNKGLIKNFSPEFLKKYENKCFIQLKQYEKLSIEQKIKTITGYWNTYDNYALSIMYLKFISYINMNKYEENDFIKFLSKLLLINIDPNPENRLNIVETIHTFNTFLYQKRDNTLMTFEEIIETFIHNKEQINKQLKKERKLMTHDTKTMKQKRMTKF